ncbi:MAG: ABC-2 family transporter protein [Myxococcota bacterium]|nr:ABC-2 family transporter protein [Deltaproteobacteria bacterium]MDQ3333780.1 ABC-2 family transporter protein [Myxococcota bacterium]
MNALRLYGRYLSVSLRSQLQYRASVIMQSLGALMITAVDFLAILALFSRFGQIRGWTLPEVALFYGMISIAWAICDAMGRGFEVMGQIIKAGDFDRVLLRPRSTVLQMLGYELTIRRIGRLLQGTVVLTYAIIALDLDWTVPRALLLFASIAGTICVFLGLLVMQATSSFWTTETLEVWNAFTYGGLTMAQYPLSIYRGWFRRLFMFAIPLGSANYLPGIAILGREDPLGTPVVVQWLAPLAGPAFLAIALLLWRWGVRHYRSTGS